MSTVYDNNCNSQFTRKQETRPFIPFVTQLVYENCETQTGNEKTMLLLLTLSIHRPDEYWRKTGFRRRETREIND